jgi:hypothetical protein
MTWFAFKGYDNGAAIDLAGPQETAAVSIGFHGYATQAQAQANPNSVNALTGWWVTTIIADYGTAVKEGAQPGGPNANILNPVTAVKASTSAVANSIPGLAQVGSFFGALEQGATWIRVGEALLGIVLIAVGVARLTNAVPAATKIAGALA